METNLPGAYQCFATWEREISGNLILFLNTVSKLQLWSQATTARLVMLGIAYRFGIVFVLEIGVVGKEFHEIGPFMVFNV